MLVMDSHFTIGALMAFLAYKDQFSQRASTLIDRLFELRMLRLHGERLADIALTEPEKNPVQPDQDGMINMSKKPTTDLVPGQPIIALKDVQFRYSDMSPLVLDGLNLTIYPGESVAIVGPSGSGKTTLMHVLLGLRQITSGEVLLHGESVAKMGTRRALSLVATVNQDDILFAGSIADNISFFDPNTDDERIITCAKLADIYDDIEAMPMAFNTLIGDMGTVLSGGQKQRVLIARALYMNPKILILDEATSSLDVESEERVNEAIKQLKLTRIIIAHRPQTIMSAQRAVVLRQGKIVADLPTDNFAAIRDAMRVKPGPAEE